MFLSFIYLSILYLFIIYLFIYSFIYSFFLKSLEIHEKYKYRINGLSARKM